MPSFLRRSGSFIFLFAILPAAWRLACVLPVAAQPAVVYSTGFEPADGFILDQPLHGHGGWVALGSDQIFQTTGNGITADFFEEDDGQQAFVGFTPLTAGSDVLNTWRPLNYDPVGEGLPLVKFNVSFAIYDSTNGNYDSFRWSVYNSNNGGQRLLTLDFDNFDFDIGYFLDSTNRYSTGYQFELDGIYDLEVAMNFAGNLWSATLGSTLIINSQPLTTRGLALNLGDIDAVWFYGVVGAPGDNFMVFDNFRVTAEPVTNLPFDLEFLSRSAGGEFHLRLNGEPGRSYAIERTDDFSSWLPLSTNATGTNGMFEFTDNTAGASLEGYYRARLVP